MTTGRDPGAVSQGRRCAPIALFVYNRPEHTRRTVEALKLNTLAGDSDLHVFCDGHRREGDRAAVEDTRRYVRGIAGFRSVRIVERTKNLGLAASIIGGVSELVEAEGRVIVLEDDMLSSLFFLQYMNDALECYKDDDRVISIHAYTYPTGAALPETFFLRGADCWGWGTWSRAWKLFEPDGSKLLRELRERKLGRVLDMDGAYPFRRMLKNQIAGKNDSWAIRWHASAVVHGKLTLYPGRPLICNIGTDTSGTHTYTPTDVYAVQVADRPVRVENIPVMESAFAKRHVARFLRSLPWKWMVARLTSWLRPAKSVR